MFFRANNLNTLMYKEARLLPLSSFATDTDRAGGTRVPLRWPVKNEKRPLLDGVSGTAYG